MPTPEVLVTETIPPSDGCDPEIDLPSIESPLLCNKSSSSFQPPCQSQSLNIRAACCGVSRAAGALDVAFGRVWNGGMGRGVGYLYCVGARR